MQLLVLSRLRTRERGLPIRLRSGVSGEALGKVGKEALNDGGAVAGLASPSARSQAGRLL